MNKHSIAIVLQCFTAIFFYLAAASFKDAVLAEISIYGLSHEDIGFRHFKLLHYVLIAFPFMVFLFSVHAFQTVKDRASIAAFSGISVVLDLGMRYWMTSRVQYIEDNFITLHITNMEFWGEMQKTLLHCSKIEYKAHTLFWIIAVVIGIVLLYKKDSKEQ